MLYLMKLQYLLLSILGAPHDLTSSGVCPRSIPPRFKLRTDYVRRVFNLSLRPIFFGNGSAHLAYLVHQSGRKTFTVYPFWDTFKDI